MENKSGVINDLVFVHGKSCAEIAELLKKLGGDMQGGLKRIADYYLAEGNLTGYSSGKVDGKKQGRIEGVMISTAVSGVAFLAVKVRDKYYLHRAIAAHQDEGEKILQVVQKCEHEAAAGEAENDCADQKKFCVYSTETGERLTDAEE